MPGEDATSVSPEAQSPNGCDEQRGKCPGAPEKTKQQRRRDRLKDTNADGWRDGGRWRQVDKCETRR